MDIERLSTLTKTKPMIEDTSILQVRFYTDWNNRGHDRTVLWSQPDQRRRVHLLVYLQTNRPIACALTISSWDHLNLVKIHTFLLPLIPSAEPGAVAQELSRVDPPPGVALGIRT